MRNIKYLVYINGQSTKLLVNSIREAKLHAQLHLEDKPSLRVECYSAPATACIWVYCYDSKDWIKIVDCHDTNLCCSAAESKERLTTNHA